MRSGQPKCVCAPECKTKNHRPKRGGGNHHANSQFKSHHHGQKQQKPHQQRVSNEHSGKSGHHQSIDGDDDDNNNNNNNDNTSHDDVQFFNNDLNNTNRLNKKSDKIISIIAPIPHPSNLSSSHRSKKIHNTAQLHNGNSGNSNRNGRRLMIKSSKHFVANSSGNSAARQHHPSGINHRHKFTTHKNEYSNSSLIDNNIVNVNHRRQTSVEQQIKSKFYGHDIPYPPIDLPVSY